MSATQIHPPPPLPLSQPRLASARERLVRASDHLWRVQDAAGRVIGHLRVVADPLGLRYRAERLQLAAGAFRVIGEFWRPDDAVQALRNS